MVDDNSSRVIFGIYNTSRFMFEQFKKHKFLRTHIIEQNSSRPTVWETLSCSNVFVFSRNRKGFRSDRNITVVRLHEYSTEWRIRVALNRSVQYEVIKRVVYDTFATPYFYDIRVSSFTGSRVFSKRFIERTQTTVVENKKKSSTHARLICPSIIPCDIPHGRGLSWISKRGR